MLGMASANYNHLGQLLAEGDVVIGTDTIRMRLLPNGATFDATDVSMTDVGAAYTGASDQTVTCAISRTGDNTTFRVNHGASGVVTWAALANSGGAPPGAVLFKFVTDDAGSFPLAYVEFTTPPTPNGSDYVFTVTQN